MSVKQHKDDSIPRNDIPENFKISNTSNGLTLHEPDKGIVIDVWERERGMLVDQYPYKIEVAKDQETLFEGACESCTAATDKAINQANKY